MAIETVTLPRELADRVSVALRKATDMIVALEYLGTQQPQDEAMAGCLYALQAITEKLDGAIGDLPQVFPLAVEAHAQRA